MNNPLIAHGARGRSAEERREVGRILEAQETPMLSQDMRRILERARAALRTP
jgi:hypothetical protein